MGAFGVVIYLWILVTLKYVHIYLLSLFTNAIHITYVGFYANKREEGGGGFKLS